MASSVSTALAIRLRQARKQLLKDQQQHPQTVKQQLIVEISTAFPNVSYDILESLLVIFGKLSPCLIHLYKSYLINAHLFSFLLVIPTVENAKLFNPS